MQNAVVVGIVAAPLTLLLVARQVDLSVGLRGRVRGDLLHVVAEAGYGMAVAIPAAFAAAMLVAVINAFAITKLRVNSIITTLGTLLAFRGLTKIVGAGSNIPVDGFELIGRRAHRHPRHRGPDLGLHPPRRPGRLLGDHELDPLRPAHDGDGREPDGRAPRRHRPGAQRRQGLPAHRARRRARVAHRRVLARCDVAPTTAQGLEFLAITAVILGGASLCGGRGTILGTTIAVLILAVLDNGLTLARVSSFWQEVVRGGSSSRRWRSTSCASRAGKADVRFEL